MSLRRILLLTVLLLLPVFPVSADILTDWPTEDCSESAGYVYSEGALPDWLAEVFEGRLRPEDSIISSLVRAWDPAEELAQSRDVEALVIVQREGQILLMAASRNAYDANPGWMTGIETDRFLQAEDSFALLPLRRLNTDGSLSDVGLGLQRGNQVLSLRVISGEVTLEQCLTVSGDGTKTLLFFPREGGELQVMTFQGSPEAWEERGGWADFGLLGNAEQFFCICPTRLWAWEETALPQTESATLAYAESHSLLPLPEGVAYIEANLRKAPTGQSESLGMYRARASLLGSREGERWPWFEVRIGSVSGFVAGPYVFRQEGACRIASQTAQIAETVEDTDLMDEDGRVLSRIPAGTRLHVLTVSGTRVHAILPKQSLGWETDWEGSYGFLERTSVRIAGSPAELNWQSVDERSAQ